MLNVNFIDMKYFVFSGHFDLLELRHENMTLYILKNTKLRQVNTAEIKEELSRAQLFKASLA